MTAPNVDRATRPPHSSGHPPTLAGDGELTHTGAAARANAGIGGHHFRLTPMKPLRIVASLAVPFAGLACAGPDAAIAPDDSPALFTAGARAPEARVPYLVKTGSGRCTAPSHRAFDFWLGSWAVYDSTGLTGTNRITSVAAGCGLTENWVAENGFPGRSVNSYDRVTGSWHQVWVDGGANLLILQGGPAGPGSMTMSQTRPQFFGGPLVSDRIQWGRIEGGHVRQTWDQSTDQGATFQRVFDGEYRRDTRPQATPAAFGVCSNPARVRFGYFNFTVGTWRVRRVVGADSVRLGETVVAKDLDDCLLSETFRATGGAQAIGFAALDVTDRRWYREYLTSDGTRVTLRGDLVGNSMVMAGAVGASQTWLRVTWQSIDPTRYLQLWERSSDGGVSYRPAETVVFDQVR